jgi:hypothetical protein
MKTIDLYLCYQYSQKSWKDLYTIKSLRYQILFKSQYGFRTGHNKTHATIDFLDIIEQGLENDEFAIEYFVISVKHLIH